LYNLTNAPVRLDGQDLAVSAQPLQCTDPLPAAVADRYYLVPACLARAAHARSDIVWSGSIPDCGQCAPVATKRSWFSRLAHRQTAVPALRVIEHYTPEEGRQGVGAEFFRRRYLQ
jgi:hypothetical protein